MKQQTAVEWFYDILTSENWEYKTYEEQDEIYQKVKQMEMEQMKGMWRGGQWSVELGGNFEQYYNETYKL